ncbi:MAG: putative nucleotide-diphospho-sugar transferase [Bacteroidales bacterium]|jgi:hypothetical protein|nr:putative nucleotide-diphospho-sugar transferase [Bacteroidales bacterium]
MNDYGVLYVATDSYYLNQAVLSASSLKRYCDVNVGVVTDMDDPGEIWDVVLKYKPLNPDNDIYMADKLRALTLSPFKKTLYLDADTYIMSDITPMFDLLNRFDMVFAHGHNRNERFLMQTGQIMANGKYTKAVDDSIPYSFAPIQGGLIMFGDSQHVKDFICKIEKEYHKKRYFDDQAVIRELLWQHNDILFYILPPEYNFNSIDQLKRWRKANYKEARPVILHYTREKGKDIEQCVNRIYNIDDVDKLPARTESRYGLVNIVKQFIRRFI